MITYHITAWCSFPHYATFEVEARNRKDALEKARQQAQDEDAEPCDGGSTDWDEFEIRLGDDDAKPRTHLEPSKRVEAAAQPLLDAARFALPVLERLASRRENRQERRAYSKLRAAINKATRP
jgi:hypothetical protein